MALSVNIVALPLAETQVQLRAIILPKNFSPAELSRAAGLVDYPELFVQQRNFKGIAGSSVLIPEIWQKDSGTKTVRYTVFIGLGEKDQGTRSIELWRRAVANVVRIAQQQKISTIALEVPSYPIGETLVEQLVEQGAIAAMMAGYEFTTFKRDTETQQTHAFAVDFCVSAITPAIQQALDRAQIIAKAVNDARQLINLPPNIGTPAYMAHYAHQEAHKLGLVCKVFDKQAIRDMEMGGITAVGQGSINEPKFVILEHKSSVSGAPTIALVGKGITFDSGGLSLKPAKSMETMKDDMSGAAAVLHAMFAIAQLRCPINVIGLMPFAENMPSGMAQRPGDIIKFYNGTTAEVLNTDAEGRLILADALAYAVQQYKPAAIVDIATLTGACAAALGHFFTGLLSPDEAMVQRLQDAAERSGDAVWRLPFTDDYKAAMRSPVADICNIGKANYMAGATTAAVFLEHFVGDVPWAHLDIAGSAFDVPDIPYYRPATATGAGTRLLVEFALQYGA